jgi:hypothetical protein
MVTDIQIIVTNDDIKMKVNGETDTLCHQSAERIASVIKDSSRIETLDAQVRVEAK